MSYTKGEWHVGEPTNKESFIVYATNEDLEIICKVHRDKILHNKVQDFEANAQLIAAAPDLLEALIKLLKEARQNSFEVDHNVLDTAAEAQAEAAIKYATKTK